MRHDASNRLIARCKQQLWEEFLQCKAHIALRYRHRIGREILALRANSMIALFQPPQICMR
jgi:hypothetical protein